LSSPGTDSDVVAYECAGSWPTTDEAFAFEVAVCLQDSVRIDSQLGDHLSDCRQLVTGPKVAKAQGMANLMNQLKISCHPGAAIQAEFNHCLI
jgi:hypothetical protein